MADYVCDGRCRRNGRTNSNNETRGVRGTESDCASLSTHIDDDAQDLLERRTTTSFLIDDILRPDFGARHLKCVADQPTSSADLQHSSSTLAELMSRRTFRSTTMTSTDWTSATLRYDATQHCMSSRSDSDRKSAAVNVDMLPAWIYCTRYSDRPSSGCKRGPRRSVTGYKRRVRSEYNVDQLVALTTEFNKCQYLTEERRTQLANSLSLTESQVKIWFQNRRAKMKKKRRGYYDIASRA